MAAIVGIHGIGQQFGDGFELTSVWYDALRDGLAASGSPANAVALAAGDVRVAFFGDLFRPLAAMGPQDPPYSPSDIQPGLERDLLTELYRAAVAQDPALSPPEGAMGPGSQARPGHAATAAALAYVRQRGSARADRQPQAGQQVPH